MSFETLLWNVDCDDCLAGNPAFLVFPKRYSHFGSDWNRTLHTVISWNAPDIHTIQKKHSERFQRSMSQKSIYRKHQSSAGSIFAWACSCHFVSNFEHVFRPDRVRFPNHSITSCRGASNKIKTILSCCLLAAIPLEHELAHTHTHDCGRRGFSIGPTRTRVILPARHSVLVFSATAVFMTPL